MLVPVEILTEGSMLPWYEALGLLAGVAAGWLVVR